MIQLMMIMTTTVRIIIKNNNEHGNLKMILQLTGKQSNSVRRAVVKYSTTLRGQLSTVVGICNEYQPNGGRGWE